jgi:hypothetical protein
MSTPAISTLEQIFDFPSVGQAQRFGFAKAEEGHLVDARQLTVNQCKVFIDDAVRFSYGFQVYTNIPDSGETIAA